MTFHSIVKTCRIIVFTLFCLTGTAVHADDFPERPSPPVLVNDYANFLNASEAQTLEQKLVAYNDSTSTQICIVTMKNIGDYEIADYADQLANKWQIGMQGKNNGLLILLVKEPHGITIRTGYGMEGTLPDAIVKRLIEQIAKPNFKQGNYYAGLDQMTTVIMQIQSGTYKADAKGKSSASSAFFIMIVILILVAVFSVISKGGGGGRNSGGFGGGFLAGSILGSGGFSSGGGYSGGGGFGGFGGGSFGGGGASGSW